MIDEWFILLKYIIVQIKNQLLTSYSLNRDVNRRFYIPALSNCKHVYDKTGTNVHK